MDTVVFQKFRRIVYDRSGIYINENKVALISARVGKRMRELGIDDHKEYLNFLLGDTTDSEIVNLLDVISTNVTSFFREGQHFEFISSTLDKWYNDGQRKFRFWSAASSTGEEPFTLAMTIADKLSNRDADVRILATDISTRVLKKCIEGVYSYQSMANVPQKFITRFFNKLETGGKRNFVVNEELRNMVTFSRLNLSKPPFLMRGPFDAVFCRNVMIYFDNQVRQRLLEEIYRLIKPGGYLFVGHAESLTGILSGFKSVMPSVYCKA